MYCDIEFFYLKCKAYLTKTVGIAIMKTKEEIMDREEILSRAKNEPDEMEYAVTEKALGISTIVIPLLCLLFVIMRIISNDYIICDLVVLVLAQVLIQQFYQYIKIKEKKRLIFIIVLSILTIVSIVGFFMEMYKYN